MKEELSARVLSSPFPHLIIQNFYNKKELNLVWEELRFLTKPGKLLPPEDYGGVVGYTDAKALCLDVEYNHRIISNILTVNRRIFDNQILEPFSKIHDCCGESINCNYDITKVRYYHNGDRYDAHVDRIFHFLAFSYFYKEPKRFTGGELIFPKYNYELTCENNSLIIMPSWVQHGVKHVSIEDSDYYDGSGRYCISSFFGSRDDK